MIRIEIVEPVVLEVITNRYTCNNIPILPSSYLPTPLPPLTTSLPSVWDASSLLILLVERETDLPKSSPLSKSWQVGNRSSRGLLDMCGRGYVPPGNHGGL